MNEDDTVPVLLVPPQDLYVLNEDHTIIFLCNDCVIPSDVAGYVKNTEDCAHVFTNGTDAQNTTSRPDYKRFKL